jgi:hypothetical protein
VNQSQVEHEAAKRAQKLAPKNVTGGAPNNSQNGCIGEMEK